MDKGNILKLQEKKCHILAIRQKEAFEITPWQREAEARWLKAVKIRIDKLIEK